MDRQAKEENWDADLQAIVREQLNSTKALQRALMDGSTVVLDAPPSYYTPNGDTIEMPGMTDSTTQAESLYDRYNPEGN